MKQYVKVPFGCVLNEFPSCAYWVKKVRILTKKNNPNQSKPNQSKPNQSKPNQSEPNQSEPNQSKPNQSNWKLLKSPRAPWSYFFHRRSRQKHPGVQSHVEVVTLVAHNTWESCLVEFDVANGFQPFSFTEKETQENKLTLPVTESVLNDVVVCTHFYALHWKVYRIMSNSQKSEKIIILKWTIYFSLLNKKKQTLFDRKNRIYHKLQHVIIAMWMLRKHRNRTSLLSKKSSTKR